MYTRQRITIFLVLLVSLALSSCGLKPQPVQITVLPDGLKSIEATVPSKDYAFYTSTDSAPKSLEELQQFSLSSCLGDAVMNRGIQIALGLGMTKVSITSGGGDTCIETVKNAKTLLVVRRSYKLPADVKVVEIIFK